MAQITPDWFLMVLTVFPLPCFSATKIHNGKPAYTRETPKKIFTGNFFAIFSKYCIN